MTTPHSLEQTPGGVVRTAIVTVSDRVWQGGYADRSGPALAERIERAGGVLAERAIVPDEIDAIAAALRDLSDAGAIDLILTTGGTGFAPRDVTPEATRRVVDREAPGLAELMRRVTAASTPAAALSRAVCGLRGKVLIVNLPGSPAGAVECLEAVLELLPHAIATARGLGSHPGPPGVLT